MTEEIISFNDCAKVRTSSFWICVFCEQSKNCKPFKNLIKTIEGNND